MNAGSKINAHPALRESIGESPRGSKTIQAVLTSDVYLTLQGAHKDELVRADTPPIPLSPSSYGTVFVGPPISGRAVPVARHDPITHDRIMSTIVTHLREARSERGWSQEGLARRSGISRAEISAIETGRVTPSTAVALALAEALDQPVEQLFRLSTEGSGPAGVWAWEPHLDKRFWLAEAFGEILRYPAESTAMGYLPQDGPVQDSAGRRGARLDPHSTLVVAGCDPAAGILAEVLRPSRVRLLPFLRSSSKALELLGQRRVHAAGVHLGASVAENEREVSRRLGRGYRLLPLARWREGVALAPGVGIQAVSSAMSAGLRWVGREEGSGARRCLDEILAGHEPPDGYSYTARDHRGVVETIRTGWAQAGVCVQLAAEEAGLDFLPVQAEAYDLCYPVELEGDWRLRALREAVRSRLFRGLLGGLPGYEAA